MSLTLFPMTANPTRRGRPRASLTTPGRARLLVVGHLRYHELKTESEVASAFGVTDRTIRRWSAAALDLDGPEGDALRALAARRRGRAS